MDTTRFRPKFRHRRHEPRHYVLVVEDDIEKQRDWFEFLNERYDNQGRVVVSIVSNAPQALGLMKAQSAYENMQWPLWVVLDFDIQLGDGLDLLREMRAIGYDGPVIAASGLDDNNERLLNAQGFLGAQWKIPHKAKSPVLRGILDRLEGPLTKSV